MGKATDKQLKKWASIKATVAATHMNTYAMKHGNKTAFKIAADLLGIINRINKLSG